NVACGPVSHVFIPASGMKEARIVLPAWSPSPQSNYCHRKEADMIWTCSGLVNATGMAAPRAVLPQNLSGCLHSKVNLFFSVLTRHITPSPRRFFRNSGVDNRLHVNTALEQRI